MTYCSGLDGINPESMPGSVLGFDPAGVYRTYDEYANDAERYFLEYFMRDAYQYYDGEPVDEAGRRQIAQILMGELNFINKEGQPLKMMTPLPLDSALLERPLYH